MLWLAISCATSQAPTGALALPDPDLAAAFVALHEPIYDAYDLSPRDRDPLHALLSASFAGEALTTEYIEHFTTLAMLARDETSIEVMRVDYERVEVIERGPDFVRVEADWSVGGVVTHLQHKHTRVNRYVAAYTLEEVAPGQLRITDTRMRDLERVRGVLSSIASGEGFLGDELPSSGGGFMSPSDLFEAGLDAGEVKPELDPDLDPTDTGAEPIEKMSLDDFEGMFE